MGIRRTIILFTVIIAMSKGQKPSPCPKIFNYEAGIAPSDSKGRWFGVITLLLHATLEGVWLKVELDRPALLLGGTNPNCLIPFVQNWLGEAVSPDNKEFTIKSPDYKIEAEKETTIRFFVKYEELSEVPSVVRIKLNGNTICGAKDGAKVFLSHTTSSFDSLFPTVPSVPKQNLPTIQLDAPQMELVTRTRSEDSVYPGDLFLRIQPLATKVECGTIASRSTPLIAFGQHTSQGDWPWHAAIFHTLGTNQMYTCGATLISANHVLTAAHCVTHLNSGLVVSPDNIVVYLGKYNLKKQGKPVQGRDVEEIHVHPGYSHVNLSHDIAVVKLEQPVDIDKWVRPCCLWDEGTDLSSVINRQGTVVGWGFDEDRQVVNTLGHVQMPVVGTDQCIKSNPEVFGRVALENDFCAGFRNGTNVCHGDSGSGIFFPKNSQMSQWQIRGIVSVGVALQGQESCDTSQYVAFADVAQHLDWIKQLTR